MDTLVAIAQGQVIITTEDIGQMEKPADDAPEYEKCKWWRTEIVGLSREQLAPLIGFSAASIKDFERPGKVIDDMARKRYRMACAAFSMGVEFAWTETTVFITRPVRISFPDRCA